MECYFWTSGVIERREHGYERIMLTKINALVTTIDDVFDIYGTLQELQLFTTTIQRLVRILDGSIMNTSQFFCFEQAIYAKNYLRENYIYIDELMK